MLALGARLTDGLTTSCLTALRPVDLAWRLGLKTWPCSCTSVHPCLIERPYRRTSGRRSKLLK